MNVSTMDAVRPLPLPQPGTSYEFPEGLVVYDPLKRKHDMRPVANIEVTRRMGWLSKARETETVFADLAVAKRFQSVEAARAAIEGAYQLVRAGNDANRKASSGLGDGSAADMESGLAGDTAAQAILQTVEGQVLVAPLAFGPSWRLVIAGVSDDDMADAVDSLSLNPDSHRTGTEWKRATPVVEVQRIDNRLLEIRGSNSVATFASDSKHAHVKVEPNPTSSALVAAEPPVATALYQALKPIVWPGLAKDTVVAAALESGRTAQAATSLVRRVYDKTEFLPTGGKRVHLDRSQRAAIVEAAMRTSRGPKNAADAVGATIHALATRLTAEYRRGAPRESGLSATQLSLATLVGTRTAQEVDQVFELATTFEPAAPFDQKLAATSILLRSAVAVEDLPAAISAVQTAGSGLAGLERALQPKPAPKLP